MTKVDVTCTCGTVFQAREADVRRGWGKFCSKSCKAKKQTKETGIAGPHYKASGRTVQQMRNGHFAKSQFEAGCPNGHTPLKHKFCHCGRPAVNGIITNFDDGETVEWSPKHGAFIQWGCELHLDDTHPFDMNNFDLEQ